MATDGKVCIKCKEWKSYSEFYNRKDSKDGYRNDCKQCVDTRNKDYAQRNADKVREYKLEWYHSNANRPDLKAKVNERNRSYYNLNRDKELARAKQYRSQPQAKEVRKRYRQLPDVKQKHTQRMRSNYKRPEYQLYRKQWRSSNAKRDRLYTKLRRSRVRGNGGSISLEQWITLCELCDNRCICCGEQNSLTLDHIVPVSKGGQGKLSNVQPLCVSCNSAKGVKDTDYRPDWIKEWAKDNEQANYFFGNISSNSDRHKSIG